MSLNRERLVEFLLRPGKKKDICCLHFCLAFYQGITDIMRQGKSIRGIRRSKVLTLFLFADDIIIHIWKPQRLVIKQTQTIKEFTNTKLIYKNQQLSNTNNMALEKAPFKIILIKIKYFKISLTRIAQKLYKKNLKHS